MEIFAFHLANVFTPNPCAVSEVAINCAATVDHTINPNDSLIDGVTENEVFKAIQRVGLKKASGYNLLLVNYLENCQKGITYLTHLYRVFQHI